MNLKSEILNLKFPTSRRPRRSAPRRGFTFMEILFAVIIMGVGMIMVAAMFPAAIKQTQANVEDHAATAVGHAGVKIMQQIARQQVQPSVPNGPTSLLGSYMHPVATRNPSAALANTYPYVFSFHNGDIRKPTAGGKSRGPKTSDQTNLWNAIKGNVIVPSDPRYAWVPFYSRDSAPVTTSHPSGWADSFQLFLIPVRARAFSEYTGAMLVDSTFQPTQVDVTINAAPIPPSTAPNPNPTVTFKSVIFPSVPNPIAAGCYLIIADDRQTKPTDYSYNGVVIHLGNESTIKPGDWEIAVDPINANVNFNRTVLAYVVGNGGLLGPSQDIGVISTVVHLPGG
jgi:prepilin-type N-terminal cleavage/methylation domain-containing protein